MMKMLGALLHMLGKAAEAAEAVKDDEALRKWVRAMERIVQVEYEVRLPPASPRHPSHLCASCTLAGGGARGCAHISPASIVSGARLLELPMFAQRMERCNHCVDDQEAEEALWGMPTECRYVSFGSRAIRARRLSF